MKEQQPIGITELEQKLGNIDGALGKANRISKTIGTPEFGRPELDISPSSQLEGTAYLDAAVRVGMVKEALEERAKPTLLLQKENVEKEISLKKQQGQLEKIREFVQRGLLSESVLEEAQRTMGNLSQAVVSTEVPSGPERSNFIFPDGKMFSNLTPQETKILTSLLGTSKEKPISSYEWAQSVYGNDNNGNSRSKIGSQLPKIKRKISEAGWEIVTDFHGPLRGKLSPAWYYLQQKEATASGSQKFQEIDEKQSFTTGGPTETPPNEPEVSQTQVPTHVIQQGMEVGENETKDSAPLERRPYYVDFARSGGVIESHPTRMFPELVFTGKTKSQLDIELEQHAKMVRETLGESSHEGASLRRAVIVSKSVFFDLSLTEPGIVALKDNFYTGWFYSIEGEQKHTVFRKLDNISLSDHGRQSKNGPYFLLDKSKAVLWDESMKQGPLTVERMDELFISPGIDEHPSYEPLSRLNLRQLTSRVASVASSFWTTFKTFSRSDRSDNKRDFLKNNLIDLVILNQIHERSHRAALAEVRKSMERNELTVFPLGQDGCVVRYRTDNVRNKQEVMVRTLPLPHNLAGHFQRYGRLSQQPMTKEEFEALYRELVDPNTKLF